MRPATLYYLFLEVQVLTCFGKFNYSFFQGCCSELEAMAAGGITEASTAQEMEQQILKFIPKLQLKIGEIH